MDTMDKCWEGYKDIIDNNPFLSREEELNLSKKLRNSKSKKDRQNASDKLFKANLRLVLKEAHSYNKGHNGCYDFLDLVNAGSEGLSIAIQRFDPEKYKTRLTTFSVPWIRLKITEEINKNCRNVYIPTHLIHKSHAYKKLQRMTEVDDKDLTDSEAMEKLSISENALRNIKVAQNTTVYLDAQITNGEGNPTTLKDVIPDTAPHPDEILVVKERKSDILEEVKKLSPLEQDVLGCRYLGYEKINLSDVGRKYGVSGERIRQIERKALRLLRRRMKNRFGFKR